MEFALPDLGEGLDEAEILAWHVSVGDHVVADQPLLSVETDKAVVDIPSPASGRVAELLVEAGAIVTVGTALVQIDEAASVAKPGVVGELPEARAQSPAAERPDPAPLPDSAPARAPKAAPAVRKLARAVGVDLSAIEPTGPGGTVTGDDVTRASGRPSPRLPVEEARRLHAVPGSGWETLRGPRRAMARNMARAHAEVVPATLTELADVHHWDEATEPMARLIEAMAAACLAEPALNAWFDGARLARRIHRRLDLGIAVDTPDGLFVPVLRGVQGRDRGSLRTGLERLVRDVSARTVPAAELRGATVTLSNFGPLGGRHAHLVVVPPQVAIVGAGRIFEAVVSRDAVPVVRRSLPLSLTFDHRAVTGAEASRFLAAVKASLEG